MKSEVITNQTNSFALKIKKYLDLKGVLFTSLMVRLSRETSRFSFYIVNQDGFINRLTCDYDLPFDNIEIVSDFISQCNTKTFGKIVKVSGNDLDFLLS